MISALIHEYTEIYKTSKIPNGRCSSQTMPKSNVYILTIKYQRRFLLLDSCHEMEYPGSEVAKHPASASFYISQFQKARRSRAANMAGCLDAQSRRTASFQIVRMIAWLLTSLFTPNHSTGPFHVGHFVKLIAIWSRRSQRATCFITTHKGKMK
jgi:hypothetical protein